MFSSQETCVKTYHILHDSCLDQINKIGRNISLIYLAILMDAYSTSMYISFGSGNVLCYQAVYFKMSLMNITILLSGSGKTNFMNTHHRSINYGLLLYNKSGRDLVLLEFS